MRKAGQCDIAIKAMHDECKRVHNRRAWSNEVAIIQAAFCQPISGETLVGDPDMDLCYAIIRAVKLVHPL